MLTGQKTLTAWRKTLTVCGKTVTVLGKALTVFPPVSTHWGAGRHRSGAGGPWSRAGEPPARMNDVRAGAYRAGDEKQPSPSHIPCAKGVPAHPGPEMPSPFLHTKPVESNGDTVGSDGHPGGAGDGGCEGWVKAFPPPGGPPAPRNAFIQRVAGRDVKVKVTF